MHWTVLLASFTPGALLAHTTFPVEVFQRFLDAAGVSFEDIRQKLSGSPDGWDERALSDLLGSTIFATDFLALLYERRITHNTSPWTYLLRVDNALSAEELASDIVTLNLDVPDEDDPRRILAY